MNSSRAPREAREVLPPMPSTPAQFLVALWRFQRELQALDWASLTLSDGELAVAESTWYVICEELREGLKRARRAADA